MYDTMAAYLHSECNLNYKHLSEKDHGNIKKEKCIKYVLNSSQAQAMSRDFQ